MSILYWIFVVIFALIFALIVAVLCAGCEINDGWPEDEPIDGYGKGGDE